MESPHNFRITIIKTGIGINYARIGADDSSLVCRVFFPLVTQLASSEIRESRRFFHVKLASDGLASTDDRTISKASTTLSTPLRHPTPDDGRGFQPPMGSPWPVDNVLMLHLHPTPSSRGLVLIKRSISFRLVQMAVRHVPIQLMENEAGLQPRFNTTQSTYTETAPLAAVTFT